MKFPYTPRFLDDFQSVEHDPLLWVSFSSPTTGRSAAVLGMIDSGAAEILLHTGIGEAMGIDIASGEKALYSGIGGVIEGYRHTVHMQVRGDRNTYEVTCAFARLKAWMRYLVSVDFSKTTRLCSRSIRTSLKLLQNVQDNKVPAAKVHASIAHLCDAREQRFLYDLMAVEPATLADYPMPELYALLQAIERMWGGEDAKQLTVPPELIYYLAVCAAYVHHVLEDVEGWRAGAAHDVHHILQGFMKSVALAIKDGSVVKHEDGWASIDLFRIPWWFYDEVVQEQQIVARVLSI